MSDAQCSVAAVSCTARGQGRIVVFVLRGSGALQRSHLALRIESSSGPRGERRHKDP